MILENMLWRQFFRQIKTGLRKMVQIWMFLTSKAYFADCKSDKQNKAAARMWNIEKDIFFVKGEGEILDSFNNWFTYTYRHLAVIAKSKPFLFIIVIIQTEAEI